VTTKNAVFWDVAPCISCVNRRFGGRYRFHLQGRTSVSSWPCRSCVNRRFGRTYRLHLQGRNIRERGSSVSRWPCRSCVNQPSAHAGSSLADFSTLKMEAIHSSETSVYTRSTRHHIPEDGILLKRIYPPFRH
jgi:hypothetical protein